MSMSLIPLSSSTSPTDAPVITGGGVLTTTSGQSDQPFAQASIVDPVSGSVDTVTIQVSGNGADGTLAGGGFLTGGVNGTYHLAPGSASDITAELAGITFTPTGGLGGTSNITLLTITDSSTGYGHPVTNIGTRVEDTDPLLAPVVTGGGATTTLSEAAVKPFETASVADGNADSSDQLTITLSGGGAGGTLSGAGTCPSSGVASTRWPLDDAATLTSGTHEALTFTPTPGTAPLVDDHHLHALRQGHAPSPRRRATAPPPSPTSSRARRPP